MLPIQPIQLCRTVSVGITNVCALCEESIVSQPGHLRLGCRCLIHYSCLVKYMLLSEKLRNKESKDNQGVRCPFSYLPTEPATNTCLHTTNTNALYFLSLADLYNLVQYGELLKKSESSELPVLAAGAASSELDLSSVSLGS